MMLLKYRVGNADIRNCANAANDKKRDQPGVEFNAAQPPVSVGQRIVDDEVTDDRDCGRDSLGRMLPLRGAGSRDVQ